MMFKIKPLFVCKSKTYYFHPNRLKSTQRDSRLYYWNQVLVFSNINETIGSQSESTHKSHSLFMNKNLISMTEKGFHISMPFVVKAMQTLIQLIDKEMDSINAQKLIMPSLVSKRLWDKSGRWSQSGDEIFKLKDRHQNEFCLAPTHEEVVTHLVSTTKHLSEYQLPLYLYQISYKFRDELKAKHGLLREKEFLMKDLYTFDANESQANITYEKVCNSYENIFKKLDLPLIKAQGSVGSIGGKHSHEFLLVSDLGEDQIFTCHSCQTSFNAELVDTQREVQCLSCGSTQLTKFNGIEVGHAFFLGNRYSERFNAKFIPKDPKTKNIYEMGCYGLGVSRILAAAVEVLSQNYSIRWPKVLAPFKVTLVLPKKGSKEDVNNGTKFGLDFAKSLSQSMNEDILIDDRTGQSIGKRLVGLKALGIPYIVIAGKQITEEIPKFELIDNYNPGHYFFNHLECIQFLENHL